MLIGICYVLPDISSLLADPSGQPAAGLIYLGTRSRIAATFLTLLIVTSTRFCSIGSAAGLSRSIYGFARDGAIPGHKWLATIHPSLQIPLNALVAQTVVAALVGLIYIGSTAGKFASVLRSVRIDPAHSFQRIRRLGYRLSGLCFLCTYRGATGSEARCRQEWTIQSRSVQLGH